MSTTTSETTTALTIMSDGRRSYSAIIAGTPAEQAEQRRIAQGIFDLGCREYPGMSRTMTERVTTITDTRTVVAAYEGE